MGTWCLQTVCVERKGCIVIRNRAKARGMMQIAKEAGISRESLYKSLAPDAKPHWKTIVKVLDALGVKITLIPKETA